MIPDMYILRNFFSPSMVCKSEYKICFAFFFFFAKHASQNILYRVWLEKKKYFLTNIEIWRISTYLRIMMEFWIRLWRIKRIVSFDMTLHIDYRVFEGVDFKSSVTFSFQNMVRSLQHLKFIRDNWTILGNLCWYRGNFSTSDTRNNHTNQSSETLGNVLGC